MDLFTALNGISRKLRVFFAPSLAFFLKPAPGNQSGGQGVSAGSIQEILRVLPGMYFKNGRKSTK